MEEMNVLVDKPQGMIQLQFFQLFKAAASRVTIAIMIQPSYRRWHMKKQNIRTQKILQMKWDGYRTISLLWILTYLRVYVNWLKMIKGKGHFEGIAFGTQENWFLKSVCSVIPTEIPPFMYVNIIFVLGMTIL